MYIHISIFTFENLFQKINLISIYIMEHGIAQQSGKQIGTTAPPCLVLVFDLYPDSYSYIPEPLAQRP